MREKHYYCRDYKNRPVITVYLMEREGVLSRGVAICSKKDNPDKRVGRRIARAKCLKAFGRKKDGDRIRRVEAAVVLIDTYDDCSILFGDPKSYYDTKLWGNEKNILRIEEETDY